MFSRPFSRASVVSLALTLSAGLALAEDAETAWQRVTALDAGPGVQFQTQAQAKAGAIAHLDRQEKTLRQFLAQFPADPAHAFEARLRLVRLLQIRATFQGTDAARAEANRLLTDLEKAATGPQRVEVDFARLSFQMRSMRANDARDRNDLLRSTQAFLVANPNDRRAASLLAEVATLFDREPETQRSLVTQALGLTSDPALKGRLTDDLKRLDLLGKVVPLHGPGRQGRDFDLANYRGKVVLLVFFADFSPPSTDAIAALQKAAANWPQEGVQMLGVSLDSKPEDVTGVVTRLNIGWPVFFDGRGWNSPLVRSLGINRLPTIWLIDREGKLRSLRAQENTIEQVRDLLRGK